MLTAILGTLVIGLVVGAIAKFLMPGQDPGGCFITILLGIAGAFVAGFLGRVIGWYRARSTSRFYRFGNWRDVAFAYLSADSRSSHALIWSCSSGLDRRTVSQPASKVNDAETEIGCVISRAMRW